MLKHLEIFKFHNRLNRANFWAYTVGITAFTKIALGCLYLFAQPVSPVSIFRLIPLSALEWLTPVTIAFIVLFSIFCSLINIGLAVKIITLQVSRLHDRGLSGWVLLLALIPVIGTIYVLIQLCLPGDEDTNLYGEAQKPGLKSPVLKRVLIGSSVICILWLALTGTETYLLHTNKVFVMQVEEHALAQQSSWPTNKST